MLTIGRLARSLGNENPPNEMIWENCILNAKGDDEKLIIECQIYLNCWANHSFLDYANAKLFNHNPQDAILDAWCTILKVKA